MTTSYIYSTKNNDLISDLSLIPHPEGGYFVETKVLSDQISSPYAGGAKRSLATQIYYLLTPESSRGRMHMNKSATFHLHHSGRSLYTLVRPSLISGGKPIIKQIVMGEDHSKGEVRQLFVEGGWWKSSEIPSEDLISATKEAEGEGKERVGCLISEVVTPGFDYADHQFLDVEGLKELCGGDKESEERLLPYIRAV